MDEVTEDRLLGGRVILRQPTDGYRAGLDAALLAAACDAAPGDRVLEAGCGPGGALLAAAARRPGCAFTGIEREADALALAQANIATNGMADRVDALAGDVARGFRALGLERFDQVLANPPFFDDPASLRGPTPARRAAWIADDGLAAWTDFMLAAARDGGSLVIIHRADRLADLLHLMGAKAGSMQVRPVHPFADAPAKRVLVRAVRGGKAPLQLLPPLVLHDRDGGKHRPDVEAILRGEASLSWS